MHGKGLHLPRGYPNPAPCAGRAWLWRRPSAPRPGCGVARALPSASDPL